VKCPKCTYPHATEVVLFSSIEVDCMCCRMKAQFEANSIDNLSNSYRMPIFEDGSIDPPTFTWKYEPLPIYPKYVNIVVNVSSTDTSEDVARKTSEAIEKHDLSKV